MDGVKEALKAIASAPVLLVASDFDGTLSPLVDRPEDAAMDPRAWAALMRLRTLPHTHVAVVSGRSREDLLRRLGPGLAGDVHVIGSHGIETGGAPVRLDEAGAEKLARVRRLMEAESAALDGSAVEPKPASVAFHFRRSEAEAAVPAVQRLAAEAGRIEGLYQLFGDKVLEVFVLRPGKDGAVEQLRYATGASAVVFVGDDVTDEAVFGRARAGDLGVKVGPGPTVALARLDGQAAVADCYDLLAGYRASWLRDRVLPPIERHSILSDQRTVAVVDPRGAITWCCLPRIDSSPIFASMLDGGTRGEDGRQRGDFVVRPVGSDALVEPAQRYVGDSFVLRTEWPTLAVTDYFDCSGGRPYQRAGRSELIRVIEGSSGAQVRFAPRLDFGRTGTRLLVTPDGLDVDGWHDPIVLRSPGVAWTVVDEGAHQTAYAEVDPSRGPVVLELRYGTASMRPALAPEPVRREQSTRFWTGWAATITPPRPHADLCRRGALVIKALCQGPTGAICAAATTSLPEHLGGVRNWDYRYCWVRDACMSAASLVRMGNTGVAIKLLDWLLTVVERTDSPERLRPLYTVGGSNLGPEAEIGELSGYGGSRPVRVGNAASHQVQLDVFGPVVDLVAMLAERGAPVTPEQWRLVQAMVRAVQLRWREPDHGIWEIRGPKRHHVHTKAMCWLAVSRACMVADQAMGEACSGWQDVGAEISADVLEHGWNPRVGAFTAAYGEDALDASSLFVGLAGLVPPTDGRFIATVEAVERVLRDGPAVYRYLGDDGLPGREGAWPICATWLAEAMMMTGRVEDGRRLLGEVAALAGPTGLMAEEYDPRHRIALGNFPQAYSHLGVINAAFRLDALDAGDAAGASAPTRV